MEYFSANTELLMALDLELMLNMEPFPTILVKG